MSHPRGRGTRRGHYALQQTFNRGGGIRGLGAYEGHRQPSSALAGTLCRVSFSQFIP